MTQSLVPGTTLGSRYRLDDLLEEIDGARFWRAHDNVLARWVAVHVLDEDDDRVDDLLEAARMSATVSDPRILRVLDADVRDGKAWVINEWGRGESLDLMLERDALPADRAAWLAREAAGVLSIAHAAGVAHGRLVPENVLVNDSGQVQLIGFAIDATLRRRLRTGWYPDTDPISADVYDLAGLLYAGLTQRWPGATASTRVRPAPRDSQGPLRPRRVRAGVPRPLDAICGRVLGRQDQTRSAHQLAAVLTEYLGEVAVADPAVAPRITELPPGAIDLEGGADTGTAASLAALDPIIDPGPEPYVPPAPEPVDLTDDDVPWEPAPEPAELPASPLVNYADDELADELDRPTSTPGLLDDTDPSGDPIEKGLADTAPHRLPERPEDEDTEAHVREDLLDDAPTAAISPEDDLSWAEPSKAPHPPAPDLGPLTAKPLFAPEGSVRRAKPGYEQAAARLRTHETAPAWAEVEAQPAPEPPAPKLWAASEEAVEDDWEERVRRPWLRLPLVIGALIVLGIVAAFVIALLVRNASNNNSSANSGNTGSTGSSLAPGTPIKIVGAKDFDPFGENGENPEDVSKAYDASPTSSWITSTYKTSALGNLKPGVGLVVDLGSVQRIGSVTIDFVGSPTGVTLYGVPTAMGTPANLDGLQELARLPKAGTVAKMTPASSVRARYLVIWLTSLPKASGGYRGTISNIVVRAG